MNTPYSSLKRDCQYLHGFDSKNLEKFVELANISKGMVILDAMCGNGVLSKELSKTDNIELNLLDNSEFQLEEAKKIVKNANLFKSSISKTPFEKEKFDRVFIRSGIYEIPKEKQLSTYKEILRILKDKGFFLCWTIQLCKNNQKFFQSFAKYKDELAGFKDLVKNRYFMTKEEFFEDIKKAGFRSMKFIDLKINYIISTKKSCEIDFKGDVMKLKKLNEHIRNSTFKHPGIKIEDEGDDIKIIVPALISVSKK